MRSAERRQVIVERLRGSAQVAVAELAEVTGASEMTVRRDLDVLAAHGVLRRVHGGAVPVVPTGVEPPFDARLATGAGTKQSIAAMVASMISDGETVLLDSGTTALEVAKWLRDRPVTVMPLSLHAALALVDAPSVRILLPGGEPRPGELALAGPLALASMRSLRFDVAVLGACAFSLDGGLTAFDLGDAEVKQQALAVSRRSILAADGSKWGHAALAHVCAAADLGAVVTDESAPEDQRRELAALGVHVYVA
jgi:DeoR/GlpR family transcriptional regulator of sugar metabolism